MDNGSFEDGASGWYYYDCIVPTPEYPDRPDIGCIDPNLSCDYTFNLVPPSTVPDGTKVCGVQSSGISRNVGVCQTVFWTGGSAKIYVTARAYSEKLPSMGGGAYDNGCRVRMSLVKNIYPASRSDVTQWITFPWGDFWTTRSMNISGPGTYTIFIEAYQPDPNAIMSLLWDNVVWTANPVISITDGPTVTVPGNSSKPDSSVKIEWTTDVASTTKVDYGLTSAYGSTYFHPVPTNNHSVTLTGLQHSSTYHFKVNSAATGYTSANSDDATFVLPIQFSDISTRLSPDGKSTIVMWKTDVPTTSQVKYGTTSDCTQSSAELPDLVTEHEVTLTGLQEDTTYYFKCVARNQSGYSDAESSMHTFLCLPNPASSLQNGSFELAHGGQSPSLYPWVQYTTVVQDMPFKPIDGIIGPYPAGGPLYWYQNIQAADGSYFLGAAAQLSCKNGGVLQRINVESNKVYTLGAQFITYRVGGTDRDTRIRLGIDPNGGVDPNNSDVQWWSTYSSTNDNEWHKAAVTARTGNTGVATVFVDILQNWPNQWNIVAADNVTFGHPSVMTIGNLKQSEGYLGAVLENKIVTYIDENTVSYNNNNYYRAYIQDDVSSGLSGIAVLFDYDSTDIPAVGNKVTVIGPLVLNDKEAMVMAYEWSVDRNTYALPGPIALSHKSIGGGTINQPAIIDHTGACNVGLRVRVFGKVTQVGMDQVDPMRIVAYIDDGSKIVDEDPAGKRVNSCYGIRTKLKDDFSKYVSVGDYIAVTGPVTIEYVNEDGWPGTQDEHYAYTIITDDPSAWEILRPAGQ